MNVSDNTHRLGFDTLSSSTSDPTFHSYGTSRWMSEDQLESLFAWGSVGSVVLHSFLLAVLKCRAAHHRKINDSVVGIAKLQAYRNELFACEAKMLPISHPLHYAIWRFLCLVVISILFSARFAFAYLLIGYLMVLYQAARDVEVGQRLAGVSDLVYNGRRYKLLELSPYYSEIQDGDKNVLYYSTHDLYGLVLPDNEQATFL